MSIRSFLSSRDTDDALTFDWNGELIDFSAWEDDAYGHYTYTTRCQRYQFTFELKPVGREVRIYIVEHPSYGWRSEDPHSTHRRHDGRYYICIEHGLEPTTTPQALSWAVYWAEQTARYIRTGQAFS